MPKLSPFVFIFFISLSVSFSTAHYPRFAITPLTILSHQKSVEAATEAANLNSFNISATNATEQADTLNNYQDTNLILSTKRDKFTVPQLNKRIFVLDNLASLDYADEAANLNSFDASVINSAEQSSTFDFDQDQATKTIIKRDAEKRNTCPAWTPIFREENFFDPADYDDLGSVAAISGSFAASNAQAL